ncbi:vitamin K epoxide reductase family protein [Plantibacter sp. ME-Dv--P-122b]|uniref:vitamin K epoxide reductase family protein n=1 Tax=Plantibacter sp. ME-Dv--P-122b TaxID=3040300 RepID=UPI0025505A61|nr:vitamin K epoxide reductase family protein [Plantibacter sp. ME-Dv--P-122b]
MSTPVIDARPRGLAIFLIVAGVIGWIAAFALTLDKFQLLQDPNAQLGCNLSILVQCGVNLNSWQGAILGFPNPIIGLAAWIAPIAVGVAVLAGAQFARWFWIAFNIGFLGALGFVIWLISQSIFVLGTLCPWCMVTWSVTIPSFITVTAFTLRNGIIPASPAVRRVAGVVSSWIVVVTLGCYLVVAVIAQLRLDVLSYL